jgi:hypothetical protein
MEKFAIQFGRYTLHEKIAVGGMAEIFKASLRGLGDFEKPSLSNAFYLFTPSVKISSACS